MEVVGKIKLIGDIQTFGSNDFRKREMVVTTDEQYPQMINIEFHQDKTGVLDNYQIGQDVKVSINLRGREWINPQGEAKYFNSIVGWRIENLTQPNNQPQQQASTPEEFDGDNFRNDDDEEDDLPF